MSFRSCWALAQLSLSGFGETKTNVLISRIPKTRFHYKISTRYNLGLLGVEVNETLQIAAIYQLREYLVGKRGDRFIRPTWELLCSLLNTWEPMMEEDESDSLAPYINGKPKLKLNITKNIQSVHTVIREESGKISAYYKKEIDFIRLNLSYAWLSRIELSGANLARAQLNRSDLGYAKLNDTDLVKADLSRSNLYQAELKDSNMSGAYLENTRLIGANCTGANLSRAKLMEADLRDANLEGVDLSRANLAGAYIWETNFTNTKWIDGKTTVVGTEIINEEMKLHFDIGRKKR